MNQVVPKEELEATVEAIAHAIARAPLTTLMLSKTLLRRAWELMGMRSHLQMSTDLLDLATLSKDVREHLTRMRARSDKPRKALGEG